MLTRLELGVMILLGMVMVSCLVMEIGMVIKEKKEVKLNMKMNWSYGDDQEQNKDEEYQYEESSGAEPKTVEDNLNIEEALAQATASDDPVVGSASNTDSSYAAPGAGRTADSAYGAPEEGSGDEGSGYSNPEEADAKDVVGDYSVPPKDEDQGLNADDSYGAPGATEPDYSAPRTVADEYGAPGQYTGSQNDFPFAIVEGRQNSANPTRTVKAKVCPGGSLDVCVSVCPGITARVYGACVTGCAHRCPEFWLRNESASVWIILNKKKVT